MKSSVSAFRAQASAHRKILMNYQHQLSYGATTHHQTSSTRNPVDPASFLTGLKVDRSDNDESQNRGIMSSSGHGSGACESRVVPVIDSGSSALSSLPQSLPTSRDEEDDEEEDDDSSCQPSHEIPWSRSTNGVLSLKHNAGDSWRKLRTTVHISSALSTIQKKQQLKREDSFLKRFSTRQIPESQDTLDTGDCDGDNPDDKDLSRPRRPRKVQQAPTTVVNPDENFYYYWLMLLSSCVLYNLWTLIVRQSLPELQQLSPIVWLGCDCFTDIVFFMDVIIQFRTGYLEQGLMVYNTKKLASHYVQSRAFILDLLALLPTDLLQFNFGSNPLLRFPRFLKVYRVYHYYYMVESRTVYPNLWRVFNLIHILLILAHWFGCFYYLLSEAEGFQGDWVYPYRPGEYATLTRKYLGSLYWSTLTLTTIGDLPTPETNAEYVFTIVSYLIGVFIFATIVGQVGNVITNRNANRLEFERLLDGAKTYMRHHKVPGGMKRRVLRWYDYSWSRGRIQGGGDINTALGLLPDKLKTELALHVNLSVLKKVTIFQACQPEFLHDLVLKMKAFIFTPGDSICRKGEVAREMFIIADGILEVISETGRVLTTMKAGDFFGEIGILNLDGLNKRTADVRSVGYSELFSLSREDVLAAMKDYPEAQEILQNLGRQRLQEAQRVARAFRKISTSPGHDSSDNSTSKRLVKGLTSVLRKSRRHARRDDAIELQPLTSKVPPLRRQTKIDDEQTEETGVLNEPSISPLGAGLPLLARLHLLKEKQEREEKRHLMDPQVGPSETIRPQISDHPLPEINPGLPLLERILLLKNKNEPEVVIDKDAVDIKDPIFYSVVPKHILVDDKITSSDSVSIDSDNCEIMKKPWAMLKNASLRVKEMPDKISPPMTSKITRQPSFIQTQPPTKMYTSIDDLSPEYCGLPFVKKLKILNERQKLAELERVVRSSSLDYGDNAEAEFDGYLTRSYSEACAIEYARKLAKYNKQCWNERNKPLDLLTIENETLERRNLKSILKKLSAGSRTSSDASATPPDPEMVTAELKKLMRAPTIEGYAARHSKLSKSVTFNKYTLQSPPSDEALSQNQNYHAKQEQKSVLPLNKRNVRPFTSGTHMGSISGDDEHLEELVTGICGVIQNRLENVQCKFEHKITSLELEVQKRDDIITQLRSQIENLEKSKGSINDDGDDNDSNDDNTEADASFEDDTIDDQPFMRDGSVDTVLTTLRPELRRSSTVIKNSNKRRSWEEHSEEETLQLHDLPRSITPQNIWKDGVAISLESDNDDESHDDDKEAIRNRRRSADDYADDEPGHNNWEITMLAQQLEAKRRGSNNPSLGS
ncbi:hypothetical protein HCN44_010908 [Aphidius gifuensis]|uniref:Cyclic nucleotide-binding domain-containing protein n=1 Tax=Aphidius gifuensis TaxID=684658 RepID=A0A834Y5F2_APHGI|nr:uncharacterized protein LOC122848753 isoform X2 [Aphidius gifuensis]KAF7998500.1 hypothetical protein HCN44_010908 [Aphidius gifuensis]